MSDQQDTRKTSSLLVPILLLLSVAVGFVLLWQGDHKQTDATSSKEVSEQLSSSPRPGRRSADEQARLNARAQPCDRTVLTHLDLTRPPSEAELIAAGNLGEPLSPTKPAEPSSLTDPAKRKLQERDNLAFGTAIQTWNEHRYEEAFALFEEHLKSFPKSPWAAESQLHLGCFCQYNGRYNESADWFEGILASVAENTPMWHKAKLRRSILHLDQGNFDLSAKGFAEMRQADPDPKHQTYASYWIREIAFLKKHETALRDCGQKALARAAELMDRPDDAADLRGLTAAGPHGFTAAELHGTALAHGFDSNPVWANNALDSLSTPFVAHYNDRHYVTVEDVSSDEVRLYDNRVGGVTTMPRDSFEREWSGFAMLFESGPETAAVFPAGDLDSIVGGCCGYPRHPSDIGDDDCDKNCGLPGWSVNMVNMNFRVSDTPMWWDPPFGPPVYMSLLFNSLDSLQNYTLFGEKWSFAYSSYLIIDPGSGVQIKDGDGRLEIFSGPADSGGPYPVSYTAPAGDFRELVETADHVFELRQQDGTISHYAVPPAMSGSVPFLLSIEDRHGNDLSITHNANGAILKINHSALSPSQEWSFNYTLIELPDTTEVSRVESIDDPFGRTCTFGYDAEANLTSQTDMGGVAYGYSYTSLQSLPALPDENGNYPDPVPYELLIDSLTTPKGTTTIVTEPADGDDSSPDDGLGVFFYPAYGSPMWTNYRIRVWDPENNMQEFYFDGEDQEGFTRDGAQSEMATVSDPLEPWDWSGPYTKLEYALTGGKGKIAAVKRRDHLGAASLVRDADNYDASIQLPERVIGPDGEMSWYQFNSAGRPKVIRLPKSNNIPDTDHEIRYDYAPSNGVDLTKVYRNLNGVEKTLLDVTYYPNRDLKTVTDVLGRVLTYTWNTNGLLSTVTDSVTTDVVSVEYDTNWRPDKLKVNGKVVTDTSFDIEGRLQAVLDASDYLTTYQYDDLNRLWREDHPDGSFVETIWECCYPSEVRSGMSTGGTDRILKRSVMEHDGRGLLTSSTDTAGRVTGYGYDGAGRLVSLTDASENLTTWQFDEFGKLHKKIYPDLTEEEWSWKNAAQLDWHENRRNQKTEFEFDENGNLKERSSPDHTTIHTYDTWDRIDLVKYTQTGHSQEIHDIDHDLLGRITSIDGPWTNDTISWQYFDALRKVTRTTPGGVTTDTITDDLGRVDTIRNPLGLFTHSYQNNVSPRLKDITHTEAARPNGGSSYAGFDTSLTYHGDSLRQALATITSFKPGGGTVAKHSYGYDSEGRINSWKREAPLNDPSGPATEFEWTMYYDFGSQLSSVLSKDLAGNIVGGWHYGYDPAGNITSIQANPDATTASTMSLRSHNKLNQIDTYRGGVLRTDFISCRNRKLRSSDFGDFTELRR